MRNLSCVILIAVLAGCQHDAPVTQPVEARLWQSPNVTYRVDKLSTLAGRSQGGGINNLGWVAGYSGAPNGTRHAALWRDSAIIDLGTLGGSQSGLHSNVQWPGINNLGMIVGISHTPALDTLGEAWSCSGFISANGHVCLGFVWESGVMRPLPTLGGENGFATGVNNAGQVVGWAETPVHDPTCTAPQVLQFRAVLWEPRRDRKRALPPYPGDSTSAATAINEQGQIVGISGECDVAVGRRSATHAILWDGDRVTDLGNIGGSFWHTPMAINNRGDVVGFGNPPDGDLDGDSLRAFLWTRQGGIRDLGKFSGDAFSQALDINDRGQIVGVSCAAACQAVLWQDGVPVKLQDLVEPGFADHLWSARSINEEGQITGRLIEQGTGNFVTYVATPIR